MVRGPQGTDGSTCRRSGIPVRVKYQPSKPFGGTVGLHELGIVPGGGGVGAHVGIGFGSGKNGGWAPGAAGSRVLGPSGKSGSCFWVAPRKFSASAETRKTPSRRIAREAPRYVKLPLAAPAPRCAR